MYEHVRRVQYNTVLGHGHEHVATQPKTKRRIDLDRSELIQLSYIIRYRRRNDRRSLRIRIRMRMWVGANTGVYKRLVVL